MLKRFYANIPVLGLQPFEDNRAYPQSLDDKNMP